MLGINELTNRVVVECGALGGVTKYWVSGVRQEGDKLYFEIPYAETKIDGKWVHQDEARIMLTDGLTHMYKSPMFAHPTRPSDVEFIISVTYGPDLSVCKEGICISDVNV